MILPTALALTALSLASPQKAKADYGGLIYSKASRLCLDVYGASTYPGAAVIQWPCIGENNQRWTPVAVPYSNAIAYRNVHSGMCPDVYDGGTREGDKLIQWPCHYEYNQQFVKRSSRYTDGEWSYDWYNVGSSLCVDVPGGTSEWEAWIQQWGCNDSVAQQWIDG